MTRFIGRSRKNKFIPVSYLTEVLYFHFRFQSLFSHNWKKERDAKNEISAAHITRPTGRDR